MITLVLIAHGISTVAMTGVIWFVQVVHYPLFQKIPAEQFVVYEKAHTLRTGLVVMPLMTIELITAILLVMYLDSTVWYLSYELGLGLLLLIWLVTLLVFAPMHGKLCDGYDNGTIRRLLKLNWVRTIVWSLRSVMVSLLIVKEITA